MFSQNLLKKSINNDLRLYLVLLLGATLFIAFFLPNRNTQKFHYELNRPWAYSMLTAPFDFNIQLDDESQKRITDSVVTNFVSIYQRDYALADKHKRNLELKMGSLGSLTSSERKAIRDEVYTLYDNGIVDPDSYDKIRDGRMTQVRILTNNVAQIVPTQNMLSVAAAYALLDTVLQAQVPHEKLNSLELYKYLVPNVTLDSKRNKEYLNTALQTALASPGMVLAGESIIFPGNIVTREKYNILRSYEKELELRQEKSGNVNLSALGRLIYVVMMMVMFFVFMRMLRPRTYAKRKRMLFLIIFITAFVVVVEVVMNFRSNYLNLIPFALVPLVVATFTDSRTAFFVHLIVVFLCALLPKEQSQFIVTNVLAGLIAVLNVQELSRRSQLARAAVMIFLLYCCSWFVFHLMREGSLSWKSIESNWAVFVMYGINCGVLSSAYLIILVVERLFGFTSTVTLVELSDINSPELRTLSETCPGTFQHSLQVANLAGEAARNIRANVQAARAGALYHDIGKINNPAFFTENQNGPNPHDVLTPRQSASIVLRHVTDGLERAEKAHLPKLIRDIIAQHHGRGITRYFYQMECKAHPGETVDVEPFTYPGPNPTSKEAAIVMMADACEAATKSLTAPDKETLTAKVNGIVDGMVADGLLNDAPLTLRDITTVKQTLISRLLTFYHPRVAYPEDAKPILWEQDRANEEQDDDDVPDTDNNDNNG